MNEETRMNTVKAREEQTPPEIKRCVTVKEDIELRDWWGSNE